MSALAILLTVALAQPAGPRAAFERAAADLERFVDPGCVLYDRDDGRSCELQAIAALPEGTISIGDLIVLTRHSNPRVRTLALLRLFATGNPQVLPTIFALTKDAAATWPSHTPFAMVMSNSPYREVPKTAQTVGDVAESMMRFYLERAGYSYGSAGMSDCPAFNDYWPRRKDRTVLASWLQVQLDRATQGTLPIPQGREPKFDALRKRVEALSGNERLWYSLFVGSAEGGSRVFSEYETLSAAKALGPDALMQMIAGRAPHGDPDIVPERRPNGCAVNPTNGGMQRFVLEHAAQLLRPTDADVLLEPPNTNNSLWAIAAASLRPDRAPAMLTSAIEATDRRIFGWDQAQMAAALPRIAGEAHVPYALDWFYGRKPNEPITNAQEIFINDVVARGGPAGRALIATLVQDSRFDTISPPALRRLIAIVNTWLPSPLVEYPYESGGPDEERTFARWRAFVRGSVPQWK